MTIIKEGKTKGGKDIRLVNDGLKLLDLYSIEEFVMEKTYTGWRRCSDMYNNKDAALAKFNAMTQ